MPDDFLDILLFCAALLDKTQRKRMSPGLFSKGSRSQEMFRLLPVETSTDEEASENGKRLSNHLAKWGVEWSPGKSALESLIRSAEMRQKFRDNEFVASAMRMASDGRIEELAKLIRG